MNGSPSVKVALFIRNGGSESPCRWFYVTGIYSCCSFRFETRKFNESRLFCLRKLIQVHLPNPFQPIIIVGFCNVILFTPGRYIHTFRTVLTFSDLFRPVHKADLLCNQTGLFCHNEYLHK